MPTKIVYGEGSLRDIQSYIKHRKALLITSQGSVARGVVDMIHTYTHDIVKVIANVKSHPEFVDIEKIYNLAHAEQFELIVAVGGGSVIDVAKFVSVCSNQGSSYQFAEGLAKGKIEKEGYKLIPVISVPTTAGTGSEISPYSTIWDMREKKKYSLHLADLFCEVAIYDPALTLSVPKVVTIQTGLDTLSHALESIWNKNANPITVGYAIKSSRLVMDNLVELSDNLDNLKLRDGMMRACMYAGLAFSNTQTAVAHAMSYGITINKGIDHGIACSFTLPALIDNVIGEYDFIDNALEEIFGELSSNKLRDFLKALGVSTEFEDYGIDNEQLKELLALLQDNQRASNSLVDF